MSYEPEIEEKPDLHLWPGSDIARGPFPKQTIYAQGAVIHIKAAGCKVVIEGLTDQDSSNLLDVTGRGDHVLLKGNQQYVETAEPSNWMVRIGARDDEGRVVPDALVVVDSGSIVVDPGSHPLTVKESR